TSPLLEAARAATTRATDFSLPSTATFPTPLRGFGLLPTRLAGTKSFEKPGCSRGPGLSVRLRRVPRGPVPEAEVGFGTLLPFELGADARQGAVQRNLDGVRLQPEHHADLAREIGRAHV